MTRMMTLAAVLCLVALAADDVAVAPKAVTSLKSHATRPEADAITIPQLMSYQGLVTDTTGSPVPDGQYAMTFKLYTQETGGTEFWTEVRNVDTRSGLFSVLLGEVTPISYVPQGGSCWLEMQVHPDPVMTPRTRLVSSPYAYLAGTATSADSARPKGQAGGDLAGYYPNPAIANNAVNSDKVQNRSLRGEDFRTPCSLYSTAGNPNAAIWIRATNTGNGIRIDTAANTGMYVRVAVTGVLVDSAGSNGVRVYDAGSYGVRATARSAGGRFETNYSGGYGLYVRSYIGAAQNTAIRAYGKGMATGGWVTSFEEGGEAPGVVSSDRIIIASGTARLKDGQVRIRYPELFRENIRPEVRVRVTTTPVSESPGLLTVDRGGSDSFGVRLRRIPGMDGTDEVEFDWIAVGTLKEPAETAPDEEEE
jgi:hypothetical protein